MKQFPVNHLYNFHNSHRKKISFSTIALIFQPLYTTAIKTAANISLLF